MAAWLMVRAEVPAADRAAFDRWYETEHLPDAKAAFGALSAWRGWCDTGGSAGQGEGEGEARSGLHVAAYEFADLAQARAVLASEGAGRMVAEFDRVWQGRVARTREVVEVAQAI